MSQSGKAPDALDRWRAESGNEGEEQGGPPRKKKFYQTIWFKLALLVIVILLVVAALIWWLNARQFEDTDDAFIDTHILYIAPQIAGQVIAIRVTDNQLVHKGDVLAELNPQDAEARLDQVQAQGAQAETQYQQALASQTGVLAQAKNAADDLARYRALQQTNPQAVAQQQVDQAVAADRNARAQVAGAQAQVEGARAQIKTLQAQISAAQINLGYTKITAPEDGHVTQRSVALGNYVTPGQALMTIVPLQMWVTANFKETQLDLMRPGQPVTVAVDACGDADVRGHVNSIQRGAGQAFGILPPQNATGNYVKVVQRVPVKIVLDRVPPYCTLGPGMSIEAHRQGALMARKNRASAADQGWTPARSVAGEHNPWTIIGVISIATFMVVLDSAIANVALGHIAGSLSASYDEAAWVVTSFLVANAVIIPISGWLADVFGRKRYYMFSVLLFTLASLLCGLAPNLPFLIAARVLQGIGGGGLAPVEQSMMADTFPPSKRGAAFAVYGIVVIVAPILGPSLGGWITDNYSWHWVFLINGPIGLLSLILVSIYVDEPAALIQRARELRAGGLKVDFIGFFLSAMFLGSLEMTLDRGQREDWFSSPMITTFAILGTLSLIIFIPWELTRKNPIVRIGLFKRANFAISNVFMLLVGLVLLGTTQFIPQLLQQVLGYTATQAGEALTMGGIATIVMMPIAGMLSGKVDARYLLTIAMVLQGFALWNMSHLDTSMSFQDAAIARMIQSVGMPLMFVPISALAYVGLKPTENNQASALMNVSRNLGGTLGICFAQTMLARRSQIHQSQYVETLNPLNPNYNQAIAGISHGLMGQGLSAGAAHQAAGAVLYGTLQQQAAMLSYVDIFHLMMWMVIVCLPLIFFLRSPKAGAAPAEMAH